MYGYHGRMGWGGIARELGIDIYTAIFKTDNERDFHGGPVAVVPEGGNHV